MSMLQPSDELDIWLALHLFGCEVKRYIQYGLFGRGLEEIAPTGWSGALAPYSEDHNQTWIIIQAMRLKGFRFRFFDQPGTSIKIAQFFNDAEYGASVGHHTDAGAVAMAAQQALCAASVVHPMARAFVPYTWRKGDRVRVVSCEIVGGHPKRIGEIGEVVNVVAKHKAMIVVLNALNDVVTVDFGEDPEGVEGRNTWAFADVDLVPADTPMPAPKKKRARKARQ